MLVASAADGLKRFQRTLAPRLALSRNAVLVYDAIPGNDGCDGGGHSAQRCTVGTERSEYGGMLDSITRTMDNVMEVCVEQQDVSLWRCI